MSVIVLSGSEARAHLDRRIGRLGNDDVLVVGHWRITVASDSAKPFWLEGRGHLFQVKRTRKAAATLLRSMMADCDRTLEE